MIVFISLQTVTADLIFVLKANMNMY